jgi:hypothetical protein
MAKRRMIDNKGKRKKCPKCTTAMEFIEFVMFGDIMPEWSCDSCGHVIYLKEIKCRRGKKKKDA